MPNSRLIYALAGLLHDIGKFAERADDPMNASSYLDDRTRNLADEICPISPNGVPSHKHVLWTHRFIEKHSDVFRRAGLWGGETGPSLIDLSSRHHRPVTTEHAIITLADQWSNGLDRNTGLHIEKDVIQGDERTRSSSFISPFCRIRTGAFHGALDAEHGHPVHRYGAGEDMFPIPSDRIDNRAAYGRSWEEFEADFRRIPSENPRNFIFTLHHLLKLYTWYIPASTDDQRDSSLFEHLKTTAAFSHCLADYDREYPGVFGLDGSGRVIVEEGRHPLMLFCGDISGIQAFIYNISNRSAMKALKGRSFYVQLLAETLASEISDRVGVTIMNQVYAAGGKFYILLPNTPSTHHAVERYRQDLESRLWNQHGGSLSVNMASVCFRMSRDGNGDRFLVNVEGEDTPMHVGGLWSLLASRTSEQKRRRFHSLLKSGFDDFFSPAGMGGEVRTCAVSGEELTRSSQVRLDTDDIEQGEDPGDGIYVSDAVFKQIRIGKSLYNAHFLHQLKSDDPGGVGIGVETIWKVSSERHAQGAERCISLRTQNGRIGFDSNGSRTAGDHGTGFKLFGGISMATADRGLKPLTLEELCVRDHPVDGAIVDENSTDRLGVLRMDVDNLGNLFMHGLDGDVPGQGASFSALATLSSLFDQFFCGHLNTVRESDAFKRHVNIVYAGGDDVFAVGRWDVLLEFAIKVRNDFRRYVCGRNDISLSAGIEVVRPRFPIAKAAELSGEAEELAKSNVYRVDEMNHPKDSITLFGIPVNWTHEMPFVMECKNDLVHWIFERGILTKGVLMKMFDYYESSLAGDLSWQWRCGYMLSRVNGSKGDRETREVVDVLKKLLFTNDYRDRYRPIRFAAFIAACRWAELEIKNLKK